MSEWVCINPECKRKMSLAEALKPDGGIRCPSCNSRIIMKLAPVSVRRVKAV